MKRKMRIILRTLFLVFGVGMAVTVNVSAKENKGLQIKSYKHAEIRADLKKADKDKNGYISDKELRKVTEIYISDSNECIGEKKVIDLKGVGKLKYLKILGIDSEGKKATIKNINEMYKLKGLEELYLWGIKNKKIDLRHFKKLEKAQIYYSRMKTIQFSNPKLKILDIFNIPIRSLEISDSKKIKELSLTCYQLKKINLRKCTALTKLQICSQKLEKLDIRKNTKLKFLKYYNVKKVSSLKYNKKIKTLYVYNAPMPDIQENTQLKDIWFFNVEGEKLTLNSGYQNLKDVRLYECKFDIIRINGCPKLAGIAISDNTPISKLEICKCSNLKTVDIYNTIINEMVYEENKRIYPVLQTNY